MEPGDIALHPDENGNLAEWICIISKPTEYKKPSFIKEKEESK